MTSPHPHLLPGPDHFLHHNHLLLESPMAGQPLLHQTQHSSSPSPSPSAIATTVISPGGTTTSIPSAGDLSSSLADPPSTSSYSAAAAKIPLRPRKTRKVSTLSASPSADDDARKTNSTLVISATPRVALRVLPRPLSADGEITVALRHLRATDPQLARVIDAYDQPVFQCLYSHFHSLARSILYQQLAYKAAFAIYGRFIGLCGGVAGVVPDVVLALSPLQLRQIGVSARKASYLHDLARKYHDGILSDASIVAMDDKSLFSMLNMVKGIGAWSVHMFMIFSLHRPDVVPVGDLGVRKGVQILYGLEDVPRPSQMEQLCERWRPYRSLGAWYMWRLVDSRNNLNMASPGTTGYPIDTVGLGIGVLGSVQQQQPQMIDPIQMLPDLG